MLKFNRNGNYEKIDDNANASEENSDRINIKSNKHRRYMKCVIFFLIGLGITIYGTIALNSRSNLESLSEDVYDDNDSSLKAESSILYRPCEIYENEKNKYRVKIIQTSFQEPSAQWTEIPCFKTSSKHQKTFFKSPSAQIRIDFGQIPFNNRPPILGFGGAFTEASALNYNSLNESGKQATMELLFGRSGLGYTLGRVHMNSCDFCIKSYDFDSQDQDFLLNSFDMSVKHDVDSGMIDMMYTANEYVMKAWPNDYVSNVEMKHHNSKRAMKILASPWSPPNWMKAPTPKDPPNVLHAQTMLGSHQPSCLRDGTGPESKYAQAWALYFSKFITAYQNQGVDIWAVTVQNEPEFPAPWEACSYTPNVEAEFVTNHLGPMLNESHPDVKLFIYDHNKDHVLHWSNPILLKPPENEQALPNYVDGVALHWYAGSNDRLLDGALGAANIHQLTNDLNKVDEKKKDVSEKTLILGSEACHCPSTGYAGGDLKVAWARAERYAHAVLSDLSAGSNGWIEWNMILDAMGGPNHLGNLCDSPLLAVPNRARNANEEEISEKTQWELATSPFGPIIGDGRTREELNALGFKAEFLDVGVVVQPMYYYMGHISRHVRPGSKAVKAIVDSSIERYQDEEFGRITRTFRPLGQIVAGGGINNLAKNGIEVTLWPCEGSTRQEWKYNDLNQFQVFGHDWLGNPTTSCLSNKIDDSLGGLFLTDCNENAGTFLMVDVDDESLFNIQLIHEENNDNCILIKPLSNNGGAYGVRGGSQIILGSCSDNAALWSIDLMETGEIISPYFNKDNERKNDVCLTTGWPFLQVGAYDTSTSPDGEKAVIILNEAGETANYELKDGDVSIVSASIPAHSIQTVLFMK